MQIKGAQSSPGAVEYGDILSMLSSGSCSLGEFNNSRIDAVHGGFDRMLAYISTVGGSPALYCIETIWDG
jgi:hypothetical protein